MGRIMGMLKSERFTPTVKEWLYGLESKFSDRKTILIRRLIEGRSLNGTYKDVRNACPCIL